jgi:branched-chain amino acid transport system permease protein
MLATFIIWSMLMVGGSGNNRGAIFGAFLMWGIWTFTQFLPGFLSDANLRFVFVGMIIIIFQLYKPNGVIPAK